MIARIDGVDYELDGDADLIDGALVPSWHFREAAPECPHCAWPIKPQIDALPSGERVLVCSTCLYPFPVID